jgi:hypothetical protein
MILQLIDKLNGDVGVAKMFTGRKPSLASHKIKITGDNDRLYEAQTSNAVGEDGDFGEFTALSPFAVNFDGVEGDGSE